MLEVSLFGVETVLLLERDTCSMVKWLRDAFSMVKWLRQATNEYALPPPPTPTRPHRRASPMA